MSEEKSYDDLRFVRLRGSYSEDLIGTVSYKEECIVISKPLRIEVETKVKNQKKTDLISKHSEIHDKSRIIFWKSDEGKLITEEKETLGSSNSSVSGTINLNFCVLHCLISPFSNLRPKNETIPS